MGRGAVIIVLATAALGCRAEVATGLDEAAADEVVLALDEAGIAATKEGGRAGSFAVEVEEGQLVPAMVALRERGLPREAPDESSSLIPSAREERARLSAATAAELARSLEALDGVRRARVHLALPEPSARLLDDAPTRARASVMLRVTDAAAVDDDAVRALVAGAVTDLAAEDVAIVRSSAPTRSPGAALTRVGPVAVSAESATLLRVILGASFALNLLLVAALLAVRRGRRTETHARAPGGTEARADRTRG